MEAQVALTVAFSSSALLGLVSLIFLLTIPHRFSMGFRSGEFAGQSSTVTPWSLNQLLVPLAVWAGTKSCWKMKSPSPAADDMAAQIITDCGNFTLDFKQLGFCASPVFLQTRLWDLDFQMKCKIYFHLKRGLWTTEQQSSSFSPQPR